MSVETIIPPIGAAFFGAVVGWLAHHIFLRAKPVNVRWLATMIGVIGGGAVTALFERGSILFGAYCIGLGIAFFICVIKYPIEVATSRMMGEKKVKDNRLK